MTLLARIDLSLLHVRKTRHDLADAIGCTVQAIQNLKRRPSATLRPELMARAAHWLKVDFEWLYTGEGGDYVPADESFSKPVQRFARWMERQPPEKQLDLVLTYLAPEPAASSELPTKAPDRRKGRKLAKA